MNDISMSQLILVIPKLLSFEECDQLISYYENNPKEEGYEQSWHAITGEMTKSSFKVKKIEENVSEYQLAYNKLETAINLWLKHLKDLDSVDVYNLQRVLNFPHMIRILKYETGSSIHPHCDLGRFLHASCTLNLNDDYEGGLFSFFNKKFNIKLNKGDALIFPSGNFWVHEVTPITLGTRYSVNSFILSEPYHTAALVERMLNSSNKNAFKKGQL